MVSCCGSICDQKNCFHVKRRTLNVVVLLYHDTEQFCSLHDKKLAFSDFLYIFVCKISDNLHIYVLIILNNSSELKMTKKRDLYEKLIKHLDKKECTILTGARQVGKTTLLQKMYRDLKADHDVYFISLENFSILNDLNSDFENIFKYARRPANPLLSEKGDRIIIFVDEIQYINNPSNFLKYLFDTYQNNLKIIASGSSAFYIDDSFQDSLAGRKRVFHLKPLSFSEYLTFKDADELKQELSRIRSEEHYLSTFYSDLLHYFNDYLTFGGYPRVALEQDNQEKRALLDELLNSFLKKDIYESKIEQELKFYNLISALSAQTGQLLNKNELSNTFGIHQNTILKYLAVLQKCFYINVLPPFYQNIRKEITKMPKVYFADLGIRNKLLNRFYPLNEREDKGQLLENYVYIRLAEIYDKEQLRYWRTTDKQEVDFVITESYGTGKAFEIKFSDLKFQKKSFQKFCLTYPAYDLRCVSYDSSGRSIPVLKI